MKNFLSNSGVVLVSFVVAIIFVEGVIRVFHIESDLFSASDICIGSKHIPNKKGYYVKPDFKTYVEINKQGFRDVDHIVEKGDVYRIVMLGDSFTAGLQVPLEDTFSKRIEKFFLDNNINVEVISLAVSDHGTGQELLALECYGLAYQPDLVILNFFTGNDLDNNYFDTKPFRPYFSLDKGELVLDTTYRTNIEHRLDGENLTIFTKISGFISRHSFFVRLVDNKIKLITLSQEGNISNYSKIFNKTYDKETQEAWSLTQALIIKLKQVSFENNADFLLVRIPAPFEYIGNKGDFNTNMMFDPNKPSRIFSSFTGENNIQYLNLLPLFEDIAKVSFEDISWPHDGHFNKKGHELTAGFIYNAINYSF